MSNIVLSCRTLTFLGLLVCGATLQGARGADPQPPQPLPADAPAAIELTDAEQVFVDQMQGCTLVGSYSVDGKTDQSPQPDRYALSKVIKLGHDDWIVVARVDFGEVDVPVPVPVKIHWAGDTPVLSVTDLTIPLIGSRFTARVMFYGDRYAGTWQHGEIGGHMWGLIEHPAAAPADSPSAEPGSAR